MVIALWQWNCWNVQPIDQWIGFREIINIFAEPLIFHGKKPLFPVDVPLNQSSELIDIGIGPN